MSHRVLFNAQSTALWRTFNFHRNRLKIWSWNGYFLKEQNDYVHSSDVKSILSAKKYQFFFNFIFPSMTLTLK